MTTTNYSRDQITVDRSTHKGSPIGEAMFICGRLQTVTKAESTGEYYTDWHHQMEIWRILEATE